MDRSFPVPFLKELFRYVGPKMYQFITENTANFKNSYEVTFADRSKLTLPTSIVCLLICHDLFNDKVEQQTQVHAYEFRSSSLTCERQRSTGFCTKNEHHA